jgi:hypothetical protein
MSAKSIPPAASSDKSTQTAAVTSWRDHLKVHPAAALFPRMTEAELRELGEDIKRNGLRQKCVRLIVPHLGAFLLDGVNRMDALELVHGYTGAPSSSYFVDLSPRQVKDPYEYVISANIRRRHLAQEQKRDLIAELLQAQPEKSDRQIAATVGVSHHTVGAVREKAEGRGQIAHAATRTDTMGRQQPVAKVSRSVVIKEAKSAAPKPTQPTAPAKPSTPKPESPMPSIRPISNTPPPPMPSARPISNTSPPPLDDLMREAMRRAAALREYLDGAIKPRMARLSSEHRMLLAATMREAACELVALVDAFEKMPPDSDAPSNTNDSNGAASIT